MLRRKGQAKLRVFSIIKHLAIASLALTSCFDFEFESPYEDINGIYLEHVQSYPFIGRKLVFNGDVGYVIRGDLMQGYEFTNIDSASLLNTYITSSIITDFQIRNDYAFLALPNERLEIVDLDSPSPSFVSSIETSVAYIAVTGNYVYGYIGKYLKVFDISNIAQPIQVGAVEFEEDINGLEADSNYLYVLLDNGVFHLMELDAPAEPYIASTIDTIVFSSFTIKDDYIYLAGHGRIVTYLISENTDLIHVATLDSPLRFISMSINDNRCVAYGLHTVIFLLNMEYPFLPYISEFLDINVQPRHALIHEDYIFVLNGTSGLYIIEIKRVDE